MSRLSSSISLDKFSIGQRVETSGTFGIIRFIGATQFASGNWIGIELEKPVGKNNGSINGVEYFSCKPLYGVFVRPAMVKILVSKSPESSSIRRTSRLYSTGTKSPTSNSSIKSPTAMRRVSMQKTPSLEGKRDSISSKLPARSNRLSLKLDGNKISNLSTLSENRRKSMRAESVITGHRKLDLSANDTISEVANEIEKENIKSNIETKINLPKEDYEENVSIQNNDDNNYLNEDSEDDKLMNMIQESDGISLQDEDFPEEKTNASLDNELLVETTKMLNDSQKEEIIKQESEQSISNIDNIDNTSVKDIIEETIRERQLSTSLPSINLDNMISIDEYNELKEKYEQLEERLDIMSEFKEKYLALDIKHSAELREHKNSEIELERASLAKAKLTSTLFDAQKELAEVQKQLQESEIKCEKLEMQQVDLMESLEMMTLDKEMAEEKSESLLQELDIAKEKIEELNLNLEVLKEESAQFNEEVQLRQSIPEKNAIEVVQLEKQNERLKSALIKLRDVTTNQENEYKLKIQDLEEEILLLSETKFDQEQLDKQLEDANHQIEELKHLLNDAMGAEDMVEKLTEQNLDLNEKIEEMNITIEELEALKELNDDLEETHIENEKQLQEEIEMKDFIIKEKENDIEVAYETIKDYENTIYQFRALVKNLQNDLKELRNKEQFQQIKNEDLSSQTQNMISLNLQLQNSVMKAQSKAVELDLKKLELNQSNDHLKLIMMYLPESFYSNEHDSILTVLMFKRLSFKADIIKNHFDESNQLNMRNITDFEEKSRAIEICQIISLFSSLAKQFVNYLNECPVDIFLQLGNLHHELTGTETRLNNIISIIKDEKTNEIIRIQDINKCTDQLIVLADKYIPLENRFISVIIEYYNEDIDLTTNQIFNEFDKLKSYFIVDKSDGNIQSQMKSISKEFFKPVDDILEKTKEIKLYSKKFEKRIKELEEKSETLTKNVLDELKNIHESITLIQKFCKKLSIAIKQAVDEKVEDNFVIQFDELTKILSTITSDIFYVTDNPYWTGLRNMIGKIIEDLSLINDKFVNEHNIEQVTRNDSPWNERSKDVKKEYSLNVEIKQKLEKLNAEKIKLVENSIINEKLKTEYKEKIKFLEEKKSSENEKFNEKIRGLEETLNKKIEYEKETNSLINSLQKENNNQDNIIREQKMKLKEYESKIGVISGEDTIVPTIISKSVNNPNQVKLIESLRCSVEYLRKQNIKQRYNENMKNAIQLFNYSDELTKKSLKIMAKNDQKQKLIYDLYNESSILQKNIQQLSAKPRVVDISKINGISNKNSWISCKYDPQLQISEHNKEYKYYQQFQENIQDKIDKLKRNILLQTADKIPKLNENDAVKYLGSVHLSSSNDQTLKSKENIKNVIFTKPSQFQKVHNIFSI
ncbi:hypothetical protein BCR36DRAFT_581750 [Piromyces finnis]|uniref:CAP-Gly domain-containing protein n=1 Tax=Piromyces finnis TaxID=1754191 RepID=A0A1Y1VGH8_9FUNG|nr:hypothetical protein BCR36DRAFT_581750 [Piromyces finnis]|eukprot:ORX54872.1 hypothetical protein BCR36DRAFT_581750 [Piromyces finnis]